VRKRFARSCSIKLQRIFVIASQSEKEGPDLPCLISRFSLCLIQQCVFKILKLRSTVKFAMLRLFIPCDAILNCVLAVG
jgi:hypothetical protein